MSNIVIIGNGFDLAHGLKTSYTDFLDWFVDEINEGKTEGISVLSGYTLTKPKQPISYQTRNPCTNDLLYSIIRETQLLGWADIERIYFNFLVSGNVKKVNEEFEVIKRHLEIYLTTQVENTTSSQLNGYKILFDNFSKRDFGSTLFVNFNYTNTLSKYINPNGNNHIHIHGELNSQINPIIFGYAPNDQQWKELSKRKDNEYFRNVKVANYKRNSNEQILNDFLEENKIIFLHVLGHSCGYSDEYILSLMCEHPNVKFILIPTYNGYEGQYQAMMNLTFITGENQTILKKVIGQDRLFMMPQYFDVPNSNYEKIGSYFVYLGNLKSGFVRAVY
jgi:Bacteriophage abortive infection AbiH